MKESKAPSDQATDTIPQKLMDEMQAFYEIRKAIGDPKGKLMQDEVVMAVRGLVEVRRLLSDNMIVEDVGSDQTSPGVIIANEGIEEALEPYAWLDRTPVDVLEAFALDQVENIKP